MMLKKSHPETSGGHSTNKSRSRQKPAVLREQAEKLLSAKKGPTLPQYFQKMVHELEVHQIELKMQNEALRESQNALIASQQRYADLYDFAPIGYFTLDPMGLITEVNLTGASLLGVERGQLCNKPFSLFVAASSRDAFYRHHRNILTIGTIDGCQLQMIKKDGTSFYASIRSTAVWDSEGKPTGIRSAIGDITEQRRAGELLQEAHHELERRVEERTAELRSALSEIKTMKDQLEAENIYFRQESKMKHQFEHILGQSDGLKYVLYRVEQVAPTNTTVLILGETGTGKELIAAAIHHLSPRKDRPLITVNCAALPANLMESELFGREKGAFTGADTRQIGRFEVANDSTLCLDEIGELPLEMQAKLLRAIQYHEFERLGSSHTIKVDVRVIATTNRNLEEEIRKGRFRQDLYYRLNVFSITVPPLRQRRDDIPLLVQTFVERYARKLGKQILSIQKETMKVLQDYPWPGNIRELESVLERAVILCPGPTLQLDDKLETLSSSFPSTARTLEEMERNQILGTLSETRWRINGKDGAAAILGLHPSTLRARMHKLGIIRPETRASD